MELTNWFPMHVNPARIGWYQVRYWMSQWWFDHRLYWDGHCWYESKWFVRVSFEQAENNSWRGLTKRYKE